jgi:hypothetical protein
LRSPSICLNQASCWFQLAKMRLTFFNFARVGPRFAAHARCALGCWNSRLRIRPYPAALVARSPEA